MGLKSPKQPDPYETASAQSRANIDALNESARLNRYNTYSPFGSTEWDKPTDDPSTWSQRIQLSAPQQQQLDQQNQINTGLGDIALGRLSMIPTSEFDLSSARELPTDFSQQAQEIEQATYDRAQQLMSPGFEDRERQLRTRLANQGLPIGSEAYEREMRNFRQSRGEADLAAALDSVGAGRMEQSRLFGLTQAARQQDISDSLLERNQSINELAALIGGRSGIQAPQAPMTAQYQQSPVNIAGLLQDDYNQDLQKHNQEMEAYTQLAVSGAKLAFMCIPEGQYVDTPAGPVPIDMITAGDIVIGFSGKPVKVLMHHAYVEDPTAKRFARITCGGETIELCDKHRINDIPSEQYKVGDKVNGITIESIEWFGGVERSYDMLTEDKGYQMGGVPVNSMIAEMMRAAV